jgi:pimeloyl-ACP methyl ester carboxylesterase
MSSEKRTVYALLVGINQYPIPRHQLRGCVNDTLAFADFLEKRCQSEHTEVKIKKLLDGDATRDNIRDGFLQHLAQAGPDDVALFYFSGHGAQEPAPPELWHLEPDRLCESIVCVDSRLPGGGGNGDLVDKELSYLIWEVGKQNPHLVAVMDCCHSGSGTRTAGDDEAAPFLARQIPVADRGRAWQQYFGAEAFELVNGQLVVPQGNHILLAAAQSREYAKETSFAGQQRGAFNFALLDTLSTAKGALSYEDLMSRTRAKVMSTVPDQHPQLELVGDATSRELATSSRHTFLGGSVVAKQDYYTVQYQRVRQDGSDAQWTLDVGGVHGISRGSQLALYPGHATEADLKSFANAVGRAKVVAVLPEKSLVTLEGLPADASAVYKARVEKTGVAPVLFFLEGEATGLELVRHTYQDQANRSPYFDLTDTRTQAKYRLVAEGGKYKVKPLADERPLAQPIGPYDYLSAATILSDLATVAKWEQTLAIANPNTSFADGAARLEMYEVYESQKRVALKIAEQPIASANGIALNYELENGKWKAPKCVVRVANNVDQPLYCAMLYLGSDFGIADAFFPTQLIPAKGEGWADDKKTFTFAVDERLAKAGVLQETFVLKLVYSTNEFNSKAYNQAGLPFPTEEEAKTRGMSADDEDEDVVDWSTYELVVTVVRPPEAVELAPDQATALPGTHLKVQAHSGLGAAKVSLISTAQATRDVAGGMAAVPPVLDEVAEGTVSPVKFTEGHGTDPGLSILELTGVEHLDAVTQQQPLVLEMDAPLGEDEIIVPLASDGEFYYPIGSTVKLAGGGYEIHVADLPEPTPAGTRSLGGSIKMLFQKFVYEKIGMPFEYPILAEAQVVPHKDDFKVEYKKAAGEIRLNVAKPETQNIVLLVHGLLGDTREMTKSLEKVQVERDGLAKALRQYYDVVLTFDYENLNTTFEQNAASLQSRLSAVGLGAGHGKNLHVIAHSSGGLVVRQFVERMGGNAVVSHLVMLGTPNQGSPIANVKEWLSMGVTALLSKVSFAVWSLGPAVLLWNQAMQVSGVALAQIKPGSEFLAQLNDGATDPGIPYTILAGNTSRIPEKTMKSLFDRLKSVTDLGLQWLYHGNNDLAVSEVSIKGILHNPNLQFYDVPCDHLSYFTSPEGQAALAQAMRDRVLAAPAVPTA